MERYSDRAIEIINELHTERLDYESEYLPLIECANQCKDYEDAEERGRLVRLPCKVGDAITATVLRPYNGHSAKIQGEVSDVQIVVRAVYDSDRYVDFLAEDFGKTVFLTREKAEKALKEANRNG